MSQVFISYRQTDEAQRKRVRSFAEQLRVRGVDVVFDQFYLDIHPAGPNDGWDKWSSDRALQTTRVLIIGTRAWFQCFEKKHKPGTGLGAACEADDLRHRIYEAGGIIEGIRVVLFDDADSAHIPAKLKRYHCFHLPRDLDGIIRWLGTDVVCGSIEDNAQVDSDAPETTTDSVQLGAWLRPSAPIDILLKNGLLSQMIRVSISGLCRIQHNKLFLLVRGSRFVDSFQPVGGVLKRFPSATPTFRNLGVIDDNKIPKDNDSSGDLRVEVPGRALKDFLLWYRSETHRETHPWREFHEELIATNVLPGGCFPYIATERLCTYVSAVHWSVHFECWELLIAEIFDTHPDKTQRTALSRLHKDGHRDVRWATASEIRSRGVVTRKKRLIADIAENASWLLEPHSGAWPQ